MVGGFPFGWSAERGGSFNNDKMAGGDMTQVNTGGEEGGGGWLKWWKRITICCLKSYKIGTWYRLQKNNQKKVGLKNHN
jgi:hypothetical protein